MLTNDLLDLSPWELGLLNTFHCVLQSKAGPDPRRLIPHIFNVDSSKFVQILV